MKFLQSTKVILLALMIVCLTSCGSLSESAEDYSVSLKVDCTEIIENLGDSNYGISEEKIEIVPENGVILEINASCDESDTALDVLLDNLRAKKIHFEETDGYLQAISNIYAGDCGANSGWMFFINGELAEKGASETFLASGDKIEFKYVVDYMKLFE